MFANLLTNGVFFYSTHRYRLEQRLLEKLFLTAVGNSLSLGYDFTVKGLGYRK